MLVKIINNVAEKIKFKFRGAQNQEFVFESNIPVPFDDPEVEEKFIEAVELANIDLSSRANTSGLKKLNKIEKYYIYTAVASKDKVHLIRILLRTKKPRVRKKLVKRILE